MLKRMGESKEQNEYIGIYSRLMSLIEVNLAGRVEKLIRHFLCAPPLQTVGYILKILEPEGVTHEHRNIIIQTVLYRNCLEECVDHKVAVEISKKNLLVPCYTLAFKGEQCLVCSSKLELWKSKSKKYSKGTDPKDLNFGLSVIAITRGGSYKAKLFKKMCNRCSGVYGYGSYVLKDIVRYNNRLRDNE